MHVMLFRQANDTNFGLSRPQGFYDGDTVIWNTVLNCQSAYV